MPYSKKSIQIYEEHLLGVRRNPKFRLIVAWVGVGLLVALLALKIISFVTFVFLGLVSFAWYVEEYLDELHTRLQGIEKRLIHEDMLQKLA